MYLWLKLLHVLAVVTFLGSIVAGFFWHAHAARTRDAKLLAHTVAGVIRSDRMLVGPSALLLIASGIVLSINSGIPVLGTDWILWTLLLFVAGALVTLLRVAPLQRQLLQIAQASAGSAGFNYAAYDELAHRWSFWVVLVVLGPAFGVVLMVLKPTF